MQDNGQSKQGITFFQMEASREINSIFPEGLRSRVLQFVQFRNTARMDDLGRCQSSNISAFKVTDSCYVVNNVFDVWSSCMSLKALLTACQHFREHYMAGDRISVEHENVRRYGVISQIQDTSRLHSIFSGQPPDDQFRSFTYHITLDDSGEQLTKYKASELQRDRRVYSKLVLKQFLRSAVWREPWNGAPWMVKDHLAKRYGINTKVPEAKTRDAVMAAKKAANAANAAQSTYPPHMQNGAQPLAQSINGVGLTDGRLPLLAHGQTTFVNFAANGPHPPHPDQAQHMMHPFHGPPRPPHTFKNMPPPMMSGPPPFSSMMHPPQPPLPHGLPPHLAHLAQHMPPPGSGLPISLPFQNNFMQYQTLVPTNLPQQQVPSLAKSFEPIKYPIEDLKIRQPRVSVERPSLKFFSDDAPEGAGPPEQKTGILMKSMGPLLCVWETLNVHDTIYSLDSFTLDDFVDAMRFSSDEVECELLVEVHCAVLKQIVDESGKPQAPLPQIEESDESDNDESSKSTSPEPEPEPPVRTTRSSLRRSGANAIVKQRTPTPEPPKQMHKAAEFLSDFDWMEQCKIRNFREGGWQAILVGLLHTLSFSPVNKETCDEILAELVPGDEEPSVESIASHYVDLDVNLRIAALEIALRQTIATEIFRDQLNAAAAEMTRLRKEKIEYQKKRKEL